MVDRILVTGGAGFIGAAVTRRLIARGYLVSILDDGRAAGFDNVARTGADVIAADVADRAALSRALAGCTAIVHLAAQTSVPGSIDDPAADFELNVAGSIGVLEAVRAAGTGRLVFASSNAVIAGHGPPANEASIPDPVAPYGAAKSAVEGYLRAYWTAYGLPGVALRFANAYGPYSAHKTSVVPAFVRAYLDGGPLLVRGDGHQTRDFVHVDDIAAAVLACLDAPAETVGGQVFQIGTGQETSIAELAGLLIEVGGKAVPIEHGAPGAGDVPRNVSDIGRAAAVLGYRPAVELRQGLSATLDWFRGN